MKISGSRAGSVALRSIAIASASALALGLAACSTGTDSADPQSLTLLVEGGGKSQLSDIAALYTEETGVAVEFVELPYTGLYDRIASDLNSGAPSFDLAAIDAVWLSDFHEGLVPLDDMYTDAVTADLFPALVEEANVDGTFVGMPAWTNVEIVYYRTDLFGDETNKADFAAAYGYELAAPTTWEEYRDIAEFFTRDEDGDGTPELYGTTVVGATDAEWLATVGQAGASALVLDGDEVVINDAAHVDALDYYVSLAEFAPPGAEQVGWAESYNLFDQGQVAMYRFWASSYRSIPDTSAVYGKVGVAPMIAGPGGVGAIPGAWYLAIPQGTATSDAARDFIQFAYDHNDLAVEKAAFGVGARISAFEKYQDEPGYEHLRPMVETLNGPATMPRPANSNWQQIVDAVIIPTLQASFAPGTNYQDLLDGAATEVQTIIE